MPSARVEIVSDPEGLSRIQKDWVTLFERSNCSPVLSWHWLNQWWQEFGAQLGASPGGLRIILVWRGESLIGGLPLYLRVDQPLGVRRLGFIGTGDRGGPGVYPEYLDLLSPEHDAPECLELLSPLLLGNSTNLDLPIEWDEFDLGIIDRSSPFLERILRKQHRLTEFRISRDYRSYVSDLSGGFDTYLSHLSSTARQQARRLMRQVADQRGCFSLITDMGQSEQVFDELIELHQKRWEGVGQSGAFGSAGLSRFHRQVASHLIERKQAILGRLSNSQGHPIAVIYGLLRKKSFEFYQSGIISASKSELQSPGIVAHLFMIQRLSEQGIHTYDFLEGHDAYKVRLATSKKELRRVRIFRPRPEALVGWGLRVLHNIALRVDKKLDQLASSIR